MSPAADRTLGPGRTATYRHPWLVRVTHWVNALCVAVLVMSGLQILKAHPHLYWGMASTFADPWVSFPDIPGWATLPSWRDLALGRRWHFFFAWLFVLNGAIYLAWVVLSGRVRRVLEPTREDFAGLGRSIVEHARLRFPEGEAARRYNVIQKLSYLTVLLGLLPLMLATGLAMSPAMNAALPGLLELLGGRQSARTLHFLSATGLILFTLVHVVLVFLSGPANNLRAMITGWYVIRDRSEGP